ncbi:MULTISPECIES: Hcp family type VI secretion system effector [Variovorax]|jgi:type VI secretion system secreted protein Hcp|uniref:Hcp1 family type VI secretion system effector n=1 Tax=Variovorax paradoxus (strain S110) TaxID=543728 RepID=C5CKB3_VARPS|nr:type VI secretion system tube protein Hcp [Variovorax paradoxus]MBW8715922.1 type VI secretion system tube protein Hcp [Variovorax paradoxus]
MAADMFLKLEGVDGESKDDSHKKEIDVLSWSWGASQSGTGHVGGGSGAGKVSVQDLSVTKYVDSSSHLLLLDCCNGQHIKKGTLVVRKAGATPLEYIKLTMEDIIVSNIHTGGSGGEDRLTETITLNFSKFKYEYTPQKADGSGDGTKETGWDIAANKKV